MRSPIGRHTLKGEFVPKNPGKYKGTIPIIYRSSWELTAMRKFDAHPDVIAWASESIKIPYRNPLTGKGSIYVPDFLVVFEDKNGKRRQELVEVKPRSQTILSEAKSKYDKMSLAINVAKWKAAASWCRRHGLVFRVINENNIYRAPKK